MSSILHMQEVKQALPAVSSILYPQMGKVHLTMPNSIGQRIQLLRSTLGYTQTQLGKAAGGVSKSAVSQWERDLTEPDKDALLSMEKTENISPRWVIEGKGEMFNSSQATPTTEGVKEASAPYSKESIERLNRIEQLSPADQARLDKILDAFDSPMDSEIESNSN